MTYSQVLQAMRSVASGLRKRGLETGDTCVVIGSNFVELPLVSLAVWRAGGTQACLSVSLPRGNQLYNIIPYSYYILYSRLIRIVAPFRCH